MDKSARRYDKIVSARMKERMNGGMTTDVVALMKRLEAAKLKISFSSGGKSRDRNVHIRGTAHV